MIFFFGISVGAYNFVYDFDDDGLRRDLVWLENVPTKSHMDGHHIHRGRVDAWPFHRFRGSEQKPLQSLRCGTAGDCGTVKSEKVPSY